MREQDPGRAPASADALDKLIADSEASIARLEKLAQREGKHNRSWTERLKSHARNNSSSLLNIALAGGLFSVALIRLNEKYKRQAEHEAWEEKVAKLRKESQAAQVFAGEVEAAMKLQGGGKPAAMGPQLKAALERFRAASTATRRTNEFDVPIDKNNSRPMV
jgi:hypothetical protein